MALRAAAGGATALIGLAVLLAGLLPPHLMETGQVDPRAWAWPMLVGSVLLAAVLRWAAGGWGWQAVVPGMLALVVPPVIFWFAASSGQAGRAAIWLRGVDEVPQAGTRPGIGIMSGPMLHEPVRGKAMAGFAVAPLWDILGRGFRAVPLAALDDAGLGRVSALLLVQPRALAPGELMALDRWVRRGGRVVVLADPDLLWVDARPLGHPLRPPPVSLLDPLLHHWGLTLAPAPPRSGGEAVERRFLEDGRMIQIAGASHFLPTGKPGCRLSSRGLVARCGLGRGIAILVADADFANDALWTADPARPGRTGAWMSDAVPVLADWLSPGMGKGAGRRVWLTRADGLPEALRPALLALLVLVMFVTFATKTRGTKGEL